MKLNLISVAMLSIFSTTTFAAPTLYGEIDASIDYLPEKNATKGNKDVVEITSNNSLIG
ncbi:MAG TPA: porin, partial [Acinetobacter sp.]|nr:porin [Acinetobacter sp.]